MNKFINLIGNCINYFCYTLLIVIPLIQIFFGTDYNKIPPEYSSGIVVFSIFIFTLCLIFSTISNFGFIIRTYLLKIKIPTSDIYFGLKLTGFIYFTFWVVNLTPLERIIFGSSSQSYLYGIIFTDFLTMVCAAANLANAIKLRSVLNEKNMSINPMDQL